MTEAIKRKERGKAKEYFGLRIPRASFPNHCDSITSDSVNLTVPGLPQISKLILVNKKDVFQDQFMVPSRLMFLSPH